MTCILAKTFGRETRDRASEPVILQAFPDFSMSDVSKAADDWKTTAGGSYFATGIGGSTTGRAATLLRAPSRKSWDTTATASRSSWLGVLA